MKTRLLLALAAALTALATTAVAMGGGASTFNDATPGLNRLDAAFSSVSLTRGIATFDSTPTAVNVAALKSLGLTVQPMKHLPLALVSGPVSAMNAAVGAGIATDVYPDDRIQLFDKSSADAMGAAGPRSKGFTGKGVTVAVIDSGCDATHPDLADHVVHNVKLYSAEYANIPPDSSNTIVVPIEMLPFNNSDIGSGHGTHVAGIIAADGTTSPDHIGVAPDANLVCLSIGEVLFTTAVVTAYDYLLDQPNLWNVKVINNSWGNSFQQFDPRAPVAVATRAVADLGVNVFFAAGNAGAGEVEASLNPFSEAPWVTSVAAENLQHVRADFSSNGLMWDNSQPVTIGTGAPANDQYGGHTVFTGDRIGVYHPDITTPGDGISSTCDSTGTVVGPCAPGENATASGTSMASPAAAGAAAVLLQANSKLTVDQVRNSLQGTAAGVKRADGSAVPFFAAGYGRVDLAAAVDLVRRPDFSAQIKNAQSAADSRVRKAQGLQVARSDFWTWDPGRVIAAGSDSRTVKAPVPSTTTQLKVTIAYPSLGVVCCNLGTQYSFTVSDAAGKVLGTSTTDILWGSGTATAQIDLVAAKATYGDFSVAVRGDYAASDPDTLDSESLLGRVVVLQVAQLKK